MAKRLLGLEVIGSMKEKIISDVKSLRESGVVPCLAIVRLGEKPDDLAYERGAKKRCEGLGIECRVFKYSENLMQQELTEELKRISNVPEIHGVLLFRPLPKHIDENAVKEALGSDKDVDCFNPVNVAKVFEGDPAGFAPCTPEAVIKMLKHYKIDVSGKRVTIIGRSLVVGKPLAMLLLKENATVTICHTKTREIEKLCSSAEILIAAAGKARMVKDSFLSLGQTVIDVGVNVDESGNLCGDVDYKAAEPIVAAITPVPGGVGTVTASVLAEHVVRAAKQQAR